MTTLRLTYDELAAHTGRSPEGARMLARRWQQQGRCRVDRGNDGRARVVVEEDLVAQPPGRPPGPSPVDRPVDQPDNHLVNRPVDHPLSRLDGALLGELVARAHRAEQAAEQARAALARREVDLARVEVLAKAAADLAAAQVQAASREAEAAIAGRDELLAELRRAVEREQGRADALEHEKLALTARLSRARDELRELRRPWWRRWLA